MSCSTPSTHVARYFKAFQVDQNQTIRDFVLHLYDPRLLYAIVYPLPFQQRIIMTTQVLLQLAQIPRVETFKITLRGQNPVLNVCLDEPTAPFSYSTMLFQPRVHKLAPPRTHHRMATLDSSILRKKVGHAAIMVACARHRFKVRRAALQAASNARLFNFTGEWGYDL